MIAPSPLPDESLVTPGTSLGHGVHACCTTRHGGVSRGGFAELNLGGRVDDDPAAVAENRRRLLHTLNATSAGPLQEPAWLHQVHRTRVLEAGDARHQAQIHDRLPQADGAWTQTPGQPCVVLTADCLPIALARQDGTAVAALHAGWRSLADGIIEAGVEALRASGRNTPLAAWLGPCIGPDAFEVGDEVRTAFLEKDPGASAAFQPAGRPDHWLADLRALATRRLHALGIEAVEASSACTYRDEIDFYSHRRATHRGEAAGRMATLVWIDPT